MFVNTPMFGRRLYQLNEESTSYMILEFPSWRVYRKGKAVLSRG
jgi:hypothetical protein